MARPRLSPERRHTLCASQRSRNAFGDLTRAILYGNYKKNARAQSEHPDQAQACAPTVRTPQCGHTVWGKKKQNKTQRKPRNCLHIGSSKVAKRLQPSSSQTSHITTRHIKQSKKQSKKKNEIHTCNGSQQDVPARSSSKRAPARFQQVPAELQECRSKVPARSQQGSSGVPARCQAPARFQEGSSTISARFQQGSRTVPVFRGVNFPVTTPRPQRLIETQQILCWEFVLWLVSCFGLAIAALAPTPLRYHTTDLLEAPHIAKHGAAGTTTETAKAAAVAAGHLR